jgi:transcriptional regulator with XRE-family HTH domain
LNTEKKIAIERGQRLKSLRELGDLSTAELAKLAGLSRASISYWENAARHKGLTSSGAHKIVVALSKIGVECDVGWLLFGVGNPPHLAQKNTLLFSQTDSFLKGIPNSQDFVFSFNKEIEIFMTMNKEAVIAKIEDDLMLPLYEKGDTVGGVWKSIEALTNAKNVILRFNNLFFVRKVTKNKNNITISHLNLDISDPISFRDFKPDFVAPIIRVWK